MFQLRNLSVAAFLCSASFANASTVAIIDSGVDIKHPDLAQNVWNNPAETINFQDDDNNGFVDDINGWNFFANNNQIVDLQYTSLFSTEIDEFFLIQDKFLLGTATEADIAWVKEKVKDAAFVSAITKYGTFVHGTHVAGIATAGNPESKVMTIRLVPVENPLLQLKKDIVRAQMGETRISDFTKLLIKGGLGLLASAQGAAFELVGSYAGGGQADIANASLGVGVVQARLIIAPLIKLAGGDENDTALIDEMAKYFLDKAVEAQKKLATSAPNTLFVFASGNDGGDNDLFPVSPANSNLDNTMSVGASIDFQTIAPFSNFGKTTVDVLAPGVGIISAVPGNRYMSLSGTSQAAPYVAGIAAAVKDSNTNLSPLDIKKIIIGTVDVKAELANKVKSSGIVNRARAIQAAVNTASMSVEAAIAAANDSVADQVSTRALYNVKEIKTLPLELPIITNF